MTDPDRGTKKNPRKKRNCNCESRYVALRPHDHDCPRIGLRPRSKVRKRRPKNPGGPVQMSFKIGRNLLDAARTQAIVEEVELTNVGIITHALEFWLSRTTRRSLEKLRKEHNKGIDAWFNEYSTRRIGWGRKLDPRRNLGATNITPAIELLIADRLDIYGLTDLVTILYEVVFSDYHMGRGSSTNRARGYRLKVENILEIQAIEDLMK